MFSYYILVCLGPLLFHVKAVEHAGTEFILAFCEHKRAGSIPSFTVINNNDDPVGVKISTPKYPALGRPKVFTVRNFHALKLPHSGIQNHSSRRNLAFLIKSTKEVTVLGYNTDRKSVGGFLALPVSQLGTEYVTVTHCQKYACIIMIVGTETKTRVKVQFKINGKRTVRLSKKRYKCGDELNLILNKYETVQLKCKDDLSGTSVTSTKPVAVFSGSDFTSIVYKSTISGKDKDNIIEQMPPVRALGSFYVAPTFALHRKNYQLKIVPTKSSTVWISGNRTIHLKNQTPYVVSLSSLQVHSITSSAPILVTVLIYSYFYYKLPRNDIDCSMSVLYPVNKTRTLLNLGKDLRIRNTFPAGIVKLDLMSFLIVHDYKYGSVTAIKCVSHIYRYDINEAITRYQRFPIYSITLWMRGKMTAAMMPWPITMVPSKVDEKKNKFCYNTNRWSTIFLKKTKVFDEVYDHVTSFMAICCSKSN